MTERILKALQSIELFRNLPEPLIQQLSRFSMLRRVRAGETVFCQDEPSPYCFGIASGQISIQRVPRIKGYPPKILSVLGPGAVFGELALFKESLRSAMAVAIQEGELVAIQGRTLREWIEKDPAAGVSLTMGLLESAVSRLHQTSHELSIVHGIGRLLAGEKPIEQRFQEATAFLRASLEGVDEVWLYQRSHYWDEFERWGEGREEAHGPVTLPLETPEVQLALNATAPCPLPSVPNSNSGGWIVPLIDSDNLKTPLQGFLWVTSKLGPKSFSPNILILLSSISGQFLDILLRQRRQEDHEAQSRLQQSRQSYTL